MLWAGRGLRGHLAIAHCVLHSVSHPEGPTLQRAHPGASSEPFRDTACTPITQRTARLFSWVLPGGTAQDQANPPSLRSFQVLRTAPSKPQAQALIPSLLRADTPAPVLPHWGTCSSPRVLSHNRGCVQSWPVAAGETLFGRWRCIPQLLRPRMIRIFTKALGSGAALAEAGWARPVLCPGCCLRPFAGTLGKSESERGHGVLGPRSPPALLSGGGKLAFPTRGAM